MRGQSHFTKDRSVYWPGEFADVVNTLTGKNTQGVSIGNPLYQFNTGAIAFAASVGILSVVYQPHNSLINAVESPLGTTALITAAPPFIVPQVAPQPTPPPRPPPSRNLTSTIQHTIQCHWNLGRFLLVQSYRMAWHH